MRRSMILLTVIVIILTVFSPVIACAERSEQELRYFREVADSLTSDNMKGIYDEKIDMIVGTYHVSGISYATFLMSTKEQRDSFIESLLGNALGITEQAKTMPKEGWDVDILIVFATEDDHLLLACLNGKDITQYVGL